MECICESDQHGGYHSAKCLTQRFKEAEVMREKLGVNPCVDCEQMVNENFTHVECECSRHTEWKESHA